MVRDGEVIEALQALVEKHNRWGFWMCFHRLKNMGYPWNHKRVCRVYTARGLNRRRKTKKRLPKRVQHPLVVPAVPNAVWSIDFMHDTLYVGRRFRTFNVLDDGVREVLDIEIDTSLSGELNEVLNRPGFGGGSIFQEKGVMSKSIRYSLEVRE
ncbi:MAG: transposase [bacterium]|nr:transposase [bacterium]